MLASYDQDLKFRVVNILELFAALIRLEYYDKDIWEKVLDTIVKNKSCLKNIERLTNLYE